MTLNLDIDLDKNKAINSTNLGFVFFFKSTAKPYPISEGELINFKQHRIITLNNILSIILQKCKTSSKK